MQESDFDCISDSKALSIVGFTGVLGSIFTIRKIYKNLLNEIERRRPQVLICIDLPDFNLMLANRAQSLGTRVVYFISPQVWAWRTSRVYTIGERVDKMIVAFPFEQEFYKKANVETEFFGHPILETLPEKLDTDETIKTRLGMDLAKKVFLLAPGSRKSEILHIADSIFEAGAMLQKRLPDWQFAVSVAPHVDLANLQKIAKRKGLTPVFVQGNFQDLLKVSSFGIITSGTATLEAALLGCPMLIVYRANAINAFVGRRLVSVDHVGLPNIVAGEELFPEFLQEDANPKNLADRALGYIEDPVKFHQISAGCEQVMQKLAGGDTSNQVANTVLAIADQARKGVRG
jgi:lipid-A-disaccharide synthase